MATKIGQQCAWEVGDLSSPVLINRADGKFYNIYLLEDGFDRPVIRQFSEGNIYFSLVEVDDHWEVLCEEETIYEDVSNPTKALRAVRASLDNPDQPNLSRKISLGQGHSNTARIIGPADNFWLVLLEKNPNPTKYQLLSLAEFAKLKDNFGQAALLKALASPEVDAELAEEIFFSLRD
jgi:hypothetical protein